MRAPGIVCLLFVREPGDIYTRLRLIIVFPVIVSSFGRDKRLYSSVFLPRIRILSLPIIGSHNCRFKRYNVHFKDVAAYSVCL